MGSTTKDADGAHTKSLNRSLGAAKATKQDEFYTQLSDIEKELVHYKKHFRNKTVLCNCDDPRVSNSTHPISIRPSAGTDAAGLAIAIVWADSNPKSPT